MILLEVYKAFVDAKVGGENKSEGSTALVSVGGV